MDLLRTPEAAKLSARDLRLATELVMGVLRAHGDLGQTIEEISSRAISELDPEIAAILRLGIFQIRYLTKIPKRAAVNEAVELAKSARRRSAAGLVNAVLRKCEPRGAADATGNEWTRRALRSLPPWLAARWQKNFGKDTMQALARASLSAPPVVLRVESAGARPEAARRLALQGIHTHPGKFSPFALIVDRVAPSAPRRQFEARLDGAIKNAGVIQDEASQLVVPLLAVEPGSRVLDLCAAPGIKTGQIAETLASMGAHGPGCGSGLCVGSIIAADRSAGRLSTMRRLLNDFLPAGIEVLPVRLDASVELPFGDWFDRILVDAPCSGTGTLARNPEIKLRMVPEDLPRLARTQERILGHALRALAPGGRLVYSTCSLEPEENERIVEKSISGVSGLGLVPGIELSRQFPAWGGLFSDEGFLRTRPDRDGMDGFFAAVIERHL